MQYRVGVAVVDKDFLRWARERSGFTIPQFAKELGISADYYRNIEGGHRTLKRRPDLVKLMSEVLGIPQQKLVRSAPGEREAS